VLVDCADIDPAVGAPSPYSCACNPLLTGGQWIQSWQHGEAAGAVKTMCQRIIELDPEAAEIDRKEKQKKKNEGEERRPI
jgi:hypothetical protein